MDDNKHALAQMATQFWKLCESLGHRLEAQGSNDADAALLRYSRGQIDSILSGQDMELRRYDGQNWDASFPAHPINAEEVGDNNAVVARTIEPTVMAQGTVILGGKIILAATDMKKEQ